jgi:ornithine cyclodeaminase/alanine dehydrogenase-like protein (mu-crystallin family)
MARYLTESDVRKIFTMDAAIQAVEEGFQALSGRAGHQRRSFSAGYP